MVQFVRHGLPIEELKTVLRLQSHNDNVRYAYLSDNILKRMLDIFPSNFLNITSLFLDSCQIEVLHKDTFARLEYLEHLDLRDNKIEVLLNSFFQKNKCLRCLILKKNEIRELSQQFLESLEAICELDLSRNRIENCSFLTSYTLAILKINNNRLEQFDNNNLPNLRELYLSQNHLKHLNLIMFRFLVSITTLSLEGNNISVIEKSTFHYLQKMSHIFLGSNYIKKIPYSVFKHNNYLEVIDLSKNLIKSIGDNKFQPLRKLSTLNLSFNNLKSINQGWFQFPNLKLLNLSNNEFNDIDHYSFDHLINLRAFILDNNRANLTIETAYFQKTTNLLEISLKNSRISEIKCDAFKNLSKLNSLCLDFNYLKYVPPKLLSTSHTNICLSLKGNPLQELKMDTFFDGLLIENLDLSENSDLVLHIDAFDYLKALKQLNLCGISFLNKALPNISKLEGLEVLNLRSCCIGSFPENYFKPLKCLKKLLLGNNCVKSGLDHINVASTSSRSQTFDFNLKFKFLTKKIFPKDNVLNYLQLSKCEILSISPAVFEDLDKLTYLNLNSNYLDSLDEDLFRNLVKLEELHLSDNNLRDIEYDLLKKNVQLKVLDITKNRIQSLRPSLIISLEMLVRLYIDKECKVPDSYLQSNGVKVYFELNN